MNRYKIADLGVEIKSLQKTLKVRSKPYICEDVEKIDIKIHMTDEKLQKLKDKHPTLGFDELEYIFTGFAFSNSILDFNGFCLHSSAVSVDNKAVLFSAPCGTGKSTHTRLWTEYFGKEKAVIINDDKPAIRLVDDVFYVYGTPWSGKNNIHTNIKVPLQAIVFIRQSEENYVEVLKSREVVKLLMEQSLRPFSSNNDGMSNLLNILDSIIKKIPIYRLGCNISMDAVELIYSTVNGA
ncbi:hypothetical protein [Acetivibrio saccincola]|uniref:SynChlorMet cassette protein ScmC n=1 Tax=Acetivibrio saccincola TaxID=1677857 RepID=A0A2K9E456_9FIRM|nr:hypothetical protein [Acetivibrio saccincola]AUG57178.1 hypothetical protein HVS_06260 [Acetivibrio saccincola]NLW25997.1 hypothetical protein [Acetivibrio saccincola]PQQ67164.1 hypothetical protein B9R14_10680 [Acetivibrio saccincola]HOA96794.1 hypothetical protein [Acetivibrio saccincola]HQD27896.1 hypothetical protein [Acetivibrio saccincola]